MRWYCGNTFTRYSIPPSNVKVIACTGQQTTLGLDSDRMNAACMPMENVLAEASGQIPHTDGLVVRTAYQVLLLIIKRDSSYKAVVSL
jgi:hypothetical protein